VADVTGRFSLEDTMLDLEPVRAVARRSPDGDDYTFAHGEGGVAARHTLDGSRVYKPQRQPIGIPAQTQSAPLPEWTAPAEFHADRIEADGVVMEGAAGGRIVGCGLLSAASFGGNGAVTQAIDPPGAIRYTLTPWPAAVDARLEALEGESLPARVMRLEMALGMVINVLYAVNRDAALAAGRALAGIIPGADGPVVKGELNAGPFLEGVETAEGEPPKLDIGTPEYEQRRVKVLERLARREAGGE